MSLPDKCPFCGDEPYITASGEQCRGGDRWVLFSCDTSIYAGQDLRRTQSRKCEDAERTRLAARVAELEAEAKQAEHDAGWAFSMGAVVHRDEGDWYAVCKGECGSNPSLFAAISELRSHVEAKP